MEVKVTGRIPRAEDGITDIGTVSLAARFVFKDGELSEICFDTYEYFAVSRGRVCTRPIADEAKYPNWPQPEPDGP